MSLQRPEWLVTGSELQEPQRTGFGLGGLRGGMGRVDFMIAAGRLVVKSTGSQTLRIERPSC